jgi:hypothetical protein
MGRGPLALPNCPWLEELPRFGAVLSFPVIPKAGERCKKPGTGCGLKAEDERLSVLRVTCAASSGVLCMDVLLLQCHCRAVN